MESITFSTVLMSQLGSVSRLWLADDAHQHCVRPGGQQRLDSGGRAQIVRLNTADPLCTGMRAPVILCASKQG